MGLLVDKSDSIIRVVIYKKTLGYRVEIYDVITGRISYNLRCFNTSKENDTIICMPYNSLEVNWISYESTKGLVTVGYTNVGNHQIL